MDSDIAISAFIDGINTAHGCADAQIRYADQCESESRYWHERANRCELDARRWRAAAWTSFGVSTLLMGLWMGAAR